MSPPTKQSMEQANVFSDAWGPWPERQVVDLARALDAFAAKAVAKDRTRRILMEERLRDVDEIERLWQQLGGKP